MSVIFPTAREVPVAIVTAAGLHGEDPIGSVEGAEGMRGRWLATAALLEAFPDTPHHWIAQSCGISGRSRCENARAELRMKRFHDKYRAKWWRDADFEIVKSALHAAIAETDAEIRDRVTAAVANPAAVNDAPLPGPGGDADPAPITESNETSAFSPLFGGLKSDVLDVEVPDFSHLRDAQDRSGPVADSTPKSVSVAARSLADFQRSRIVKTARGRIIDYRQEGFVDMGDPTPGRSALDERGAP